MNSLRIVVDPSCILRRILYRYILYIVKITLHFIIQIRIQTWG